MYTQRNDNLESFLFNKAPVLKAIPTGFSNGHTLSKRLRKAVFKISKIERAQVTLNILKDETMETEELKTVGDELTIKEMKVVALSTSNEDKTLKTSCAEVLVKTDSNELEGKFSKSGFPSSTQEKLTFKPSILYGHEESAKDDLYFKKSLYEYMLHAVQSISIIKRLPQIPEHVINEKRIVLPPTMKKGTIIFDLDETLAHCDLQNIQLADHQITVVENGAKTAVGVYIRPYATECLKELAKDFELIVFTASNSNYADQVIDILDPDCTLFSHRLFRQNCIKAMNGPHIKDLRILNRDLSKTLIVDNSILSFAFQMDNGIPIIPFYNDRNDSILPKLKDYILSLKEFEDYRLANISKFGLRFLYKPNIQNFLKYYITKGRIQPNTNANELIIQSKRLPVNECLTISKIKKFE